MDLLLSAVPGLIIALLGSFAGYRMATRAARSADQRSIRREAAADLSAPLRDLRTMTRRWGRVELSSAEVSSAFLAWSEALDRQRHRLPDDWRFVRRSVRAVVGEVFGGIAIVDLRPEMGEHPMAEPNLLWQDFADDYLSYVLDAVVQWGDGQRSRIRLHDFDTWLS